MTTQPRVRPSARSGLRLRDKPPSVLYATLGSDASWHISRGPRYAYEPVEIVGPDVETIASYAQALRDDGPDEPGTCAFFVPVNAGLYSDVETRELVLECVLGIVPRGVVLEFGWSKPLHDEEPDYLDLGVDGRQGPLVSLCWLVRMRLQHMLTVGSYG